MGDPKYNNRIIYIGECIDNRDPMGLGRIRAILKTENTSDREKSANANDRKKAKNYTNKWSDEDPFLFKPLLPVFLNTVPKTNENKNGGEYIHIFYSNPDDKGNKDKFYVGGVFSSLTKLKMQPYSDAVQDLNQGSRNKKDKSLRDPETLKCYEAINEGVYSLPDDVSIDGRGSADLVLRDNHVILRAGKYVGDPQPNTYPVANPNRAFVQLSKFKTKSEYGLPEKFYRFEFKHKPINLLIEYTLTNPDNTRNKLSGAIYIYQLNPLKNTSTASKTNTESFNIKTELVDVEDKALLKQFIFRGLSNFELTNTINKFIQGVVDGEIPYLQNLEPLGPFKLSSFVNPNNRFPIYFRPQTSLYEKLTSQDSQTQEKLNIGNLMSGIKAIDSDETPGYGLIYDDSKRGTVPFKPKEETRIDKNIKLVNNTAAIMGGDEIYLLSHKSVKKGAGKIDLGGTLYGIEENKLSDDIEPKTSSVVRGEELIQLLNMMVDFMVSHVHPYHGMVPDSKSQSGITADKLLTELEAAKEKILNKYIRIN